MTPAEIINTITTKKFNSASWDPAYVFNKIPVDQKFAPHPADITGLSHHMKAGKPANTYVYEYEPFEFRMTDGRPFGHILKGTVDVSDPNVCVFETDVDTNEMITVLGSPTNRQYEATDGSKNKFRRVIIADYIKIDVIEFVKFITV